MKGILAMLAAAAASVLSAGTSPAAIVQVKVTITNESGPTGTALSPFFLGAHDGTFTSFVSGSAAGTGIQNVAELGDGGALSAAFAAAQPNGVSMTVTASTGAFGPGILLPGGSGSVVLTLDTTKNRYLSYAAMVVPSNDTFVANASPTAIPLFDASGNFIAQNFTVLGESLWDSGTEVNQPFGAAFIATSNATDHVAENGVVTQVNPGTQFGPYLGAGTAAGYVFSAAPGATDKVVSFAFEVVPEPATLGMLGAGMAGLLMRRRRA